MALLVHDNCGNVICPSPQITQDFVLEVPTVGQVVNLANVYYCQVNVNVYRSLQEYQVKNFAYNFTHLVKVDPNILLHPCDCLMAEIIANLKSHFTNVEEL